MRHPCRHPLRAERKRHGVGAPRAADDCLAGWQVIRDGTGDEERGGRQLLPSHRPGRASASAR